MRTSDDPGIVCHVYEAPEDCDLTDVEAWKAANPAAGSFRSMDDLKRLAEKAARMASFEPTFRNLNLNQRVEAASPFVSKSVWQENGAQPRPIAREAIYIGLDLSSVNDLTAMIMVSEEGDVHSTFWLPEEGLREKSQADRVPYDVWATQGYLNTTPGRTIQYEFIAEHLRGIFDRCQVVAVGFDRYNMRFLRPWLEKAGFSEEELERFVDFGQGFVSMSPALRELEARLLERKLRHGGHPVLQLCAANAAITMDPAGNRKFAKNKSSGRIDGMVALAMAIGVMPSVTDQGDLAGFINSPIRVRY